MSQENADTLRRAMEAYNRGDWDAALAEMHPEIEWHAPAIVPDQGVYRGHEGVRSFWSEWEETFADFRIEIEDVIDRGDRAIAMIRPVGTGTASGIPMQGGILAQIAEFRDGKIVRATMELGAPPE